MIFTGLSLSYDCIPVLLSALLSSCYFSGRLFFCLALQIEGRDSAQPHCIVETAPSNGLGLPVSSSFSGGGRWSGFHFSLLILYSYPFLPIFFVFFSPAYEKWMIHPFFPPSTRNKKQRKGNEMRQNRIDWIQVEIPDLVLLWVPWKISKKTNDIDGDSPDKENHYLVAW